jgi:hypothetical protein
MSKIKLTKSEKHQYAIKGILADIAQREAEIVKLRSLIGGIGPAKTRTPRENVRKRKPMSASARREISRRMKAMWASKRAERK